MCGLDDEQEKAHRNSKYLYKKNFKYDQMKVVVAQDPECYLAAQDVQGVDRLDQKWNNNQKSSSTAQFLFLT